MSGGAEFAECLACKLGYPCLAREVLVQAAEKLGVSEQTLRSKIEHSAGFWERMTSNRRLYLIALQSALADRCTSGELVYHGHAGHMLLKNLPGVLKIRLIAPMSMRVQAVMQRQGLTSKAAREYIRNVDQERVNWTRFVYGVNWRDPANYDIVLNLADVTINTACTMVATCVMLPAYTVTPQVRKTLRDFALACRVKLALATHTEWHTFDFEVKADNGKVEVFGEVSGGGVPVPDTGPNYDSIQQIVQTVDGVKQVAVRLRRFAGTAEA